MALKKRGQSSIEFFLIFMAVTVIFLILLGVVGNSLSKVRKQEAEKEFYLILESSQKEIILARESIDGYQRTFFIPEKVRNRDYSIQIVGNSVYLNSSDPFYAVSLPIYNVTGQLIKGDNLIMNSNGEVILNP